MSYPNGSPICLSCAVDLDQHAIVQVRADTMIRALREMARALTDHRTDHPDHDPAIDLNALADEIETIGEALVVSGDPKEGDRP